MRDVGTTQRYSGTIHAQDFDGIEGVMFVLGPLEESDEYTVNETYIECSNCYHKVSDHVEAFDYTWG